MKELCHFYARRPDTGGTCLSPARTVPGSKTRRVRHEQNGPRAQADEVNVRSSSKQRGHGKRSKTKQKNTQPRSGSYEVLDLRWHFRRPGGLPRQPRNAGTFYCPVTAESHKSSFPGSRILSDNLRASFCILSSSASLIALGGYKTPAFLSP